MWWNSQHHIKSDTCFIPRYQVYICGFGYLGDIVFNEEMFQKWLLQVMFPTNCSGQDDRIWHLHSCWNILFWLYIILLEFPSSYFHPFVFSLSNELLLDLDELCSQHVQDTWYRIYRIHRLHRCISCLFLAVLARESETINAPMPC